MAVGRLDDARKEVAWRSNLALGLLFPFLALFFRSSSPATSGAKVSKAKQRQGKPPHGLNNGERQGRICESSYTVTGFAASTILLLFALTGSTRKSMNPNRDVRTLSDEELRSLHQEMKKSSKWMREALRSKPKCHDANGTTGSEGENCSNDALPGIFPEK